MNSIYYIGLAMIWLAELTSSTCLNYYNGDLVNYSLNNSYCGTYLKN